MKKKILSVVMACVMAVSCCSGVMAMVAYNDNLQTTTIETNDGVIFEIKDVTTLKGKNTATLSGFMIDSRGISITAPDVSSNYYR